MEKNLAKEIRKLIKGSVLSASYIDNVRSALFFVSKIIYSFKFFSKEDCNKNFVNKLKLFLNENVLLYEEYKEYEFIDKKIENDIFDLIIRLYDKKGICNIDLSKLYEELTTESEKKLLGQVYTPDFIIDGMLDSIFHNINIHKDIKILDPSCGGGYFLVRIVERLRDIFLKKNIVAEEDVFEYIVRNNLYAVDIDKFSTFLTKITLIFKLENPNLEFNIFNCDFLLEYEPCFKFDVVVGNPPYIGHKKIGIEYGRKLKDFYHDVYYDKSDISYCFFKAAFNCLKDNGVVAYITSRYFLEAKNADRLRAFLGRQFKIISLEDYNGKKIFKNAIISPAIIVLYKSREFINNEICVVKHGNRQNDKFHILQKELEDRNWLVLNPEIAELYNKIKIKTNAVLKDIAYIKQGIITGLDKAFVVNELIVNEHGLEKELLRKWIKNSNIQKNNIIYDNLYVIYTNLIDDERNYPNTIKYLKKYKDRLSNRRECKKGIRRWFDLQWCRGLDFYEREKIVFPYKARVNRFAIDGSGYLCSADVYSLVVKDENLKLTSLLNYLNSYIFEFMFKCRAKKVGDSLYEYYPNVLENIDIFMQNDDDLACCEDVFLDSIFNLSDKEKKIIIEYIK